MRILRLHHATIFNFRLHYVFTEQRRELTSCNFNFRGRDKILKEKNFVVKCWECPLLTKAERKTDPDCSNYCCCDDAKDDSSCDEPVFEGISLQ